MTPFRFVLLALTCYKAQRIVTTDDWPPTLWFRNFLRDKAIPPVPNGGGERKYGIAPFPARLWQYAHDFFTCSHCFGAILTFALVALDEYAWRFPTVLLVAGAAAAIVGQIGQRDE